MGGSARSTFRWWLQDQTDGGRPQIVGTAYIIDQDGAVFEASTPPARAYHFGLPVDTRPRPQFEKRFIGIEVAHAARDRHPQGPHQAGKDGRSGRSGWGRRRAREGAP